MIHILGQTCDTNFNLHSILLSCYSIIIGTSAQWRNSNKLIYNFFFQVKLHPAYQPLEFRGLMSKSHIIGIFLSDPRNTNSSPTNDSVFFTRVCWVLSKVYLPLDMRVTLAIFFMTESSLDSVFSIAVEKSSNILKIKTCTQIVKTLLRPIQFKKA